MHDIRPPSLLVPDTHPSSLSPDRAGTYPRWVVLRKFLEGARESHLRCSKKARGQTVTSAVYKIFPQIKELQFGEGVNDDKEHHKDGGHLVNRWTKQSQQSTNKLLVRLPDLGYRGEKSVGDVRQTRPDRNDIQ